MKERLSQISYACTLDSLSDVSEYSTFARTVSSVGANAGPMIQIIKAMKWERIGIIYRNIGLYEVRIPFSKTIIHIRYKFDILYQTCYTCLYLFIPVSTHQEAAASLKKELISAFPDISEDMPDGFKVVCYKVWYFDDEDNDEKISTARDIRQECSDEVRGT